MIRIAGAEPPPPPRSNRRVALVCMPWGSVAKPPLALAILKQCAKRAGFEPDVHYLQVRFAAAVGWERYTRVSDMPGVRAEWFFSQSLFGPVGMGLLANSLADMRCTARGTAFLDSVDRQFGVAGPELERIAEQLVPAFMADCLSSVDWGQYLAVGFTTTFAQSLASLALAREIKACHPAVRVVFGGANVDGEAGAEFVRAFPWVDYAVHGEAEESFPQLLRCIAAGNGERVPGVSARVGGAVASGRDTARPLEDLDRSPVPDYSDYLAEMERRKLRDVVPLKMYFESSRGCWWGAKQHCTFCGLNGKTMAHRSKSPDRVLSEILRLSRECRCLAIRASDNILPTEYFRTLLPGLAAQDTDIEVFYEVKANLNRKQVALLAQAGIREIQPGIESLCTRHLELMRKGTTAIQNIQLLKLCREFGIKVYWNFLYGIPGEEPEDYAPLPDRMRLLMHLEPPTGLTPINFERFSPYQFAHEQYGIELVPHQDYRYIYPEESVDLERVVYYFEGKWDGKERRESNADPLKSVAKEWTGHWQSGAVYCYYERGPEFCVIHDRRPRFARHEPRYRRIALDAVPAFIYAHCAEIRTQQAVCAAVRQEFGGQGAEALARDWLDRLVAHRLMFREGRRYLSLAVRRRAGGIPEDSIGPGE